MILTVSDDSYFPSFVKLYQSLKNTNFDQLILSDKNIEYFSKEDLIYKKYNEILEIIGFETNYLTDQLCYSLIKKSVSNNL